MLSMSENTHKVPLELFMKNRERLAAKLRELDVSDSVVVLQGGEEVPFYDTDTTYNEFRQESYFMWAFGVIEPGFFGTIDVKTGRSMLFAPRLPTSYGVWLGPLTSNEQWRSMYEVDAVHYVDELAAKLEELKTARLLLMNGVNSDSGLSFKEPTFDGIERFQLDRDMLYNVMANLRVIKTDLELDVMRYVSKVSSAAHCRVMRMARPGRTEYQCESEFLNYCYSVGGCRHVSYTCICGSGANGAVLHYGHAAQPNKRVIQDGDMLLFDMGGEYFGYASDITCSFPANGRFTFEQRLIYEAVLAANRAVHAAAKPGASWVDMHRLAHKRMLEELKGAGLVVGDVDEMCDAGVGRVFQPHGLGHLIGLDVHDCGGYLPGHPSRPTDAADKSLRTARVLEAGMCLTIEPGCYFIDQLLDDAFADPILSKFLSRDIIKRYRGMGGIRIEDVVYVSDTGCVSITHVPRSIQDIEDWMAGSLNDKYDA